MVLLELLFKDIKSKFRKLTYKKTIFLVFIDFLDIPAKGHDS